MSNTQTTVGYLWHRNNIPLVNGGRISGADGPVLAIPNSQWSDQGAYTCLVSGSCGSVMSEPATLTITSCPPAWTSTGTEDFGPRWVHAQAYSAVNGGTLLFGGRDAANSTLGDTWLKTAAGWSNVSNSGPAARTDHAMAKLGNGHVLLFGGKTNAGQNSSALGDTWAWDGANWMQLAATGPAARAGHAMTFDSARNRVVVFGGLDAAGGALSDTWEWNGAAWSQVSTTGPAPRFAHTMAYDPARRKTLLFGGFGPGLLGDTWEWDGSAWTQVATSGVSARFYAAADFDEQLGRILLFGGSTGGSVLSDAYVWTGTVWQPQSFGTSPTPRWTHAMSYDSAASRMVLTGGAGTGPTRFADAWEQSGRPILISQPPVAMSRMVGDSVQLANTVGGTGPFTYRWKKGGANLVDSAIYSGVATPTLTINTSDPSQSGLYTLVITSPCTELTTAGTQLDISCGADFNHDGAVDGDDV
ncbi:MAG: Kelch repeat-containing protein, partial [Phycisphaerales bacterium]